MKLKNCKVGMKVEAKKDVCLDIKMGNIVAVLQVDRCEPQGDINLLVRTDNGKKFWAGSGDFKRVKPKVKEENTPQSTFELSCDGKGGTGIGSTITSDPTPDSPVLRRCKTIGSVVAFISAESAIMIKPINNYQVGHVYENFIRYDDKDIWEPV